MNGFHVSSSRKGPTTSASSLIFDWAYDSFFSPIDISEGFKRDIFSGVFIVSGEVKSHVSINEFLLGEIHKLIFSHEPLFVHFIVSFNFFKVFRENFESIYLEIGIFIGMADSEFSLPFLESFYGSIRIGKELFGF